MGNTDGNLVSLDFIRFCMGSIAKYAIFPMQDLLTLGSEARMNCPGVAAANWTFRYTKDALTKERCEWAAPYYAAIQPLEPGSFPGAASYVHAYTAAAFYIKRLIP